MGKELYLHIVLFLAAFLLWEPGIPNVFAENKDIALSDIKYNRGLLLMDSDPSLAMNELNSAKELNPKDPKIDVAIGQLYFRQNKYQEAVKAFENAINLNKNYVAAYSNLGYIYMTLKDWDKAILNFRTILNYPNIMAPHFVYNAIGWAYYEKNEFRKSIEELKNAIKHKNNYGIAYYNLGLSLLALDNFDQAFIQFENAVTFQPELVQAHNQLALVYLKKNMRQEARKEFQKVIELAPDSVLAEEAKKYLDIIGG